MNRLAPLRRRGYFPDPEAADADAGEGESPEGFVVRVRLLRPPRPRVTAGRGVARVAVPRRHAPRRKEPAAAVPRHQP